MILRESTIRLLSSLTSIWDRNIPGRRRSPVFEYVDCDRLILNGDIIDGWQLKKSGKRWKQKHTDFFKVLMKMMEKRVRRLSM